MKNKVRNSNIELLRIISMISILILHYFNFGGALTQIKELSLNKCFMYLFESVSIISVNIFVLITGYYMIEKKKVNVNKIVNIIFKIILVGGILYFISLLSKINIFDIKELIINIFPFIVGLKWFITTYSILYLLIPYLNICLNYLDKNKYLILLVLLFICFNVTSTLFITPPIKDGGYGIVNFVILYCIGGYLYKYKINFKKINIVLSFVLSLLIIFILSFITGRVWTYNNMFVMIASVSLFYLVISMKSRENKVINNFAKNTLGVYILHTNEALRKFYYFDVMKCDDFYNNKLVIVHMIISVLISYMIFTILDKGIEKILEKTLYKLTKKIKVFNFEINVE